MIIGYSDGERKTAHRLPGVWVRQGRQVTLESLDHVAEIISILLHSAVVSLDLQDESPQIYSFGLLR
ncbi:MAG: hypothetical protein CMJ77_01975 [Planctomycetaceae bacterium]|nr:hypothetical protein [Planctomycetaceae bacterium]